MKNLFNLSLAIVILATLSFTTVSEPGFIGTYGVSKDDPSHIELKLNKDHTFSYQDFSVPSKKINVVGNWELKHNYVILKTADTKVSFHHKWKFNADGSTAKSRNGLTFYTLEKR
ncbi:MAG: hypothetical protein V4580_16650 [Bacteroidota bacterium]